MGVIADESAYGRDVGDALKEMAERLDMQDLRFLAVAVNIQQTSGGNLAEILAGLAKVIRARFAFSPCQSHHRRGKMVGQVPFRLPGRCADCHQSRGSKLL